MLDRYLHTERKQLSQDKASFETERMMVKNKLEAEAADIETEKLRLDKLKQALAETQQKAVEKAHAAAVELQRREQQLEVRLYPHRVS